MFETVYALCHGEEIVAGGENAYIGRVPAAPANGHSNSRLLFVSFLFLFFLSCLYSVYFEQISSSIQPRVSFQRENSTKE